ncbi:MAG TPA: right-handed parallel beta-helix repeat-containing protein, partial [Anaerolineae bacterium]|nr:right-handed parallel beta-helix repeat-containing protein [Anaerolineae bacterium]
MNPFVILYDRNGDATAEVVPARWNGGKTLDRSIEWSMSLPLTHHIAPYIEERYRAEIYEELEGGVALRGGGLIEHIEPGLEGAEPMLQISGYDMLRDLESRRVAVVNDYPLCSPGTFTIGEMRETDITYGGSAHGAVRVISDDYDDDEPEAYDGNPATVTGDMHMSQISSEYEYPVVGFDQRFNGFYVNLDTPADADAGTELLLQYFSDELGWADLAGVSDGTTNGGKTLQQSGWVDYDMPDDWARLKASKRSGEWYWVRWHANAAHYAEDFRVAEITVRAEMPSDDGVNLIMAQAPGTWITSGYAATSRETYLQFGHEASVLYALGVLAAATGDHFTWERDIGTGLLKLVWISAFADSGLLALEGDDPRGIASDASHLLLTKLHPVRDTHELCTRIFPYGAGMGSQRADLLYSTRSEPGFTLSPADNYLANDAAEAVYDRIEDCIQFPNIVVREASVVTNQQSAADALFDMALEYLRKHSGVEQFYQLAVVPMRSALDVGKTIDVVAHRWRDGEHVLDVDTLEAGTPLYVMGMSYSWDAKGASAIELEVATTDAHAEGDDTVLASAIIAMGGLQSTGMDTETQKHVVYLTGPGGEPLKYLPYNHGAIGDGLSDDTTPIGNICTYLVPDEGGVLWIDRHYYLGDNLTLPAKAQINFLNGGRFEIAAGKTLTMERRPSAGRYQIFSGAGNVSIANGGPIFPEWFGTVGDDTADDSGALAKTIAAAGTNGIIDYNSQAKHYLNGTALTPLAGQKHSGHGAWISQASGKRGINAADDLWLDGLKFDGNDDTSPNTTSRFISAEDVIGLRVNSCQFWDMANRPIVLSGATDVEIDRCLFRRQRQEDGSCGIGIGPNDAADAISANVRVLNCNFINDDTAGDGAAGLIVAGDKDVPLVVRSLKVVNCYFEKMGRATGAAGPRGDIDIYNDICDLLVQGCTSVDSVNSLVKGNDGHRVRILSNDVYRPAGYGIVWQQRYGNTINKDLIIGSNTIEAPGIMGIRLDGDSGAIATYIQRAIVSGNTINAEGASHAAIDISEVRDIECSNNVIRGCGASASGVIQISNTDTAP